MKLRHTMVFWLVALFSLFFPSVIFADSHTPPQSHTLIINQVRGTSCCDAGSAAYFKDQVGTLSDLKLPATFTLRYDTLSDSAFLETIRNAPEEEISFGAFLEVIPVLAQVAGVEYVADDETWYEAQHAFLIGYSQDERKQLIDTYMEKYFQVFERYPTVTTAWMIDAWSLQYLKREYGVVVHQITREQYGTDSYALYGGPAHYPYWPTQNWAMIPADAPSDTMPMIVRQTITDPVENYGDDTSFHTSQPNDYLQDSTQDIEYFKHLFNQAHTQPQLHSTFALLGLENSMASEFQEEFKRQLEYIVEWQHLGSQNQVVSAEDFESWNRNQNGSIVHVYSGQKFTDQTQQAWWLTTPSYRARVRRDGNQLYMTDLRVYDQQFSDPYLESKAENLGWWIVPFALDGSRFFYNQQNPEPNQLSPDALVDRKQVHGEPTRIFLSDQADQIQFQANQSSTEIAFVLDGEIIASFSPESFYITTDAKNKTDHPWLNPILKDLSWFSEAGNRLWGFTKTENQRFDTYLPFANQGLNQERQDRYPLLFPQLAARALDVSNSYLYTNNQYAIAGRNPARLVLFPRDEFDMPTLLETDPVVETENDISQIEIKRQHGNSGMIFIDLENSQPITTQVSISAGDFSASQTIYFAPNCKQRVLYCVTHPQHAWWYVQSVLDDRQRAQEDMAN